MPRETQNPSIRYHKRGYLPHYDSSALTQFVTFRLAESLPRRFFKNLDYQLKTKQMDEIEYHRSIERQLDKGDGPTYLKDPRIAYVIAATLLKFAGERYELYSWVIMPNHVHLLLRTIEPYSLSQIIHSIKSFTGTSANKILERKGHFWSPDYFDRFIRDMVHLANVDRYIKNNPVKARLCTQPADWRWGSEGWKD